MSITKIYGNGDIYEYLNDKLHCVNGPAVIYTNGLRLWFYNDKNHCISGPAIIYNSEEKYYCYNNKILSLLQWKQLVQPIVSLISKHKKRFRQARYNAVDEHLIPVLNEIVMRYLD